MRPSDTSVRSRRLVQDSGCRCGTVGEGEAGGERDAMSDILAMHKRLREAGRFDEQAAVDQLRAAQYSAVQGTILISELLRRLSRRAGGS